MVIAARSLTQTPGSIPVCPFHHRCISTETETYPFPSARPIETVIYWIRTIVAVNTGSGDASLGCQIRTIICAYTHEAEEPSPQVRSESDLDVKYCMSQFH